MNLVILLIFNIIFKALFLNRSPNSYSLDEIDWLKKINIYPGIDDFFLRYLSVFFSIIVSILAYLLINKKTKNSLQGLFFGLVLALSPWILIVSRFINVYIVFIFIFTLIIFFVPQTKLMFFMEFVLIIIFKLFFNSNQLPSFDQIINGLDNFFKLVDFRNLFFFGDPLSPSLRIPKTGFFLYLDLLAFFTGFYFLYIVNKEKRVQKLANSLFFLGLIYFFLLPDLNYTYRGILIFFYLSLVIAYGYYFIFLNLIKGKKIKLLISIVIIVLNLLFYQEMFYSHFDKKTSYDWGYAEITTVKYLLSNQKIKKVYITSESSKLDRYFSFFGSNKFVSETIPTYKLKGLCYEKPSAVCILREHEIKILDLEKDAVKTKFSYFDGLPMYFLISSSE